MNLLSNAKEEDNLMRVKSKEIAQELLEIGFILNILKATERKSLILKLFIREV